jgi:hypothetical protein
MTRFAVRDEVIKVGEYSIPGEVRAVFSVTDGGPVRYVVRHTAEGGGHFCHIYNEKQLQPAPPRAEALLQTDEADVLTRMLADPEDVQIYRARSGLWYMTGHQGKVSAEVVDSLLASGRIRPRYSGILDDCFTAGRTIDQERTKAARAHRGRGSVLVYVGDP